MPEFSVTVTLSVLAATEEELDGILRIVLHDVNRLDPLYHFEYDEVS